jgi:sulfatase maturation enzyme AslB (radical SAM superfamily)
MNHPFAKLPMAMRDSDLYQTELEKGFVRFPERRRNFERHSAATTSETVDYLPITLDIENVSRCNFRCTMCQVSTWPKQKRADDMSFADFKALLDQQYGLIEIKLQGMGEPLLNADTYFEMIRYARERHLWVRSTNNGSLLHLKDNYKHLIDSDICEAQISIDGATKDTFEKIRVGGKFDIVTRNCQTLNGYAKDVGRHRTRMWVVVQEENFQELEMFPKFASELGFERLTLSLDLSSWGQDYWKNQNNSADVSMQFDAERGEALVEIGRQHGVETTFWFIDEKFVTGQADKLCPWPFSRAFISSDMRVVPCCMVANPETADFGDAKDFAEIWNGATLRDFRRQHLTGDLPDYCRDCYTK